jgi:ATP-binding cassette subfamily C (CFTR/MRP) protein 1
VVPRLFLGGFRFAQPFLFDAIIGYVQKPPGERQRSHGYGIIGATGLIYVGLALFTTYYQHKTYQSVTKLRGALVSFLYSKTLSMPSINLETRSPVTHMSVDVDGITAAVPTIHELWAALVETAVSVWLLQRQVGVICVVPLLFSCSK